MLLALSGRVVGKEAQCDARRSRPDLLGAALHAAPALEELAEVYRDRPVAGVSKPFAQLPGTRGDEDMQPVADRVEPEGVRVTLGRDEGIREQLIQQSTAPLTERIRIVGNVITLVVEDGQSKVEMEESRVDQLKADHLAISQRGKLAMSLWSCPEAVAGKDFPRQHGEIALGLVDGDCRLHISSAVQDAVPLMPRRVHRGFCLTFRVGESCRQRATIHHCGAVRSEDHVGQTGQRLQQVNSMACRAVGVNQP